MAPGGILGGLLGGFGGACGASLGLLGRLWGRPWASLGLPGARSALLDPLLGLLEASWASFRGPGAVLGPIFGV